MPHASQPSKSHHLSKSAHLLCASVCRKAVSLKIMCKNMYIHSCNIHHAYMKCMHQHQHHKCRTCEGHTSMPVAARMMKAKVLPKEPPAVPMSEVKRPPKAMQLHNSHKRPRIPHLQPHHAHLYETCQAFLTLSELSAKSRQLVQAAKTHLRRE